MSRDFKELDPYTSHLLLAVILLGGSKKPVRASDLCEYLNTSRATISRWISRAEDLGFLRSTMARRVQYVMTTQKALELVRTLYEMTQGISWDEEVLMAEVFSGMKEGAYYMSRPGYVMGFKEVVGYIPFPGTLNLRVRGEDISKIREWRRRVRPKVVPGFVEAGRTFGDVEVLPVVLNGSVEAHAIFPLRRHYGDDVLEIIHPESLRIKLNAKDGDIVAITLKKW
ncbi:MAG: CTP-dependent riboflavin kinase [Candidatus Korarchaeota archaeon]|nr:CTP-dependent riboflavin kinase [Candidatus Korarchaeota archaeon]